MSLLVGAIVSFALVLLSPVLLYLYRRSSALEQKWLVLLSACSPWLAGLLVMLSGLSDHWFDLHLMLALEPLIHWHHLDWFQWQSWQGLSLLMLGTWLMISSGLWIKAYFEQVIYAKRIQSLSVSSKLADNVSLLETSELLAITVGMLNPKIYVSTGLLENTSKQEEEIILAHEQSHVQKRDNFTRAIVSFACCYLPYPLAKAIKLHFVLATEKLADQYAATQSRQTDVASTLIKVAKLKMHNDNAAMSYFWDQQELSERVQQLLAPTAFSALRSLPTLTTLLIGAVISTGLVDVLHHFFDSFI
ncbi:M56 family metallopeptidase [Rhodanobacter aciditrophus]|uniref:M56 family metallopeptidase n=1 Tax=Rhodanobacter aciditrophus TaxID=1623218 RepID=A0ABW4B122_9GAMM